MIFGVEVKIFSKTISDNYIRILLVWKMVYKGRVYWTKQMNVCELFYVLRAGCQPQWGLGSAL